ncbi:MAG: helix-turn-helix domain-containing protein [Deltaproteobacteria bacterium]|nr:helix-turn-helix domain-containing protein [Deltaproteobacteria bacterium]
MNTKKDLEAASLLSPRLTVKEVRAILKCSRSFLDALHKRGVLHKFHDGRKIYWLRSEVLEHAVKGSAEASA